MFALTKASIDAAELSAIMARRMRPERVSRYLACFASRLGLVGVALDHLDGPYDEDFSGVAALKDSIAFAEWDFRLIDFNDPFQRLAIRIEHRAPELLRQQPRGLVGDAKLVLQLQRRHAVGMGR